MPATSPTAPTTSSASTPIGRRMDGPDLQFPRADRRRDRARARGQRAQGGLCLRRHLRHQQRARLRLRSDAEWMGQIYNFLGLPVGVIVHGLEDNERKAAYACDVTYGTNNELGFDSDRTPNGWARSTISSGCPSA